MKANETEGEGVSRAYTVDEMRSLFIRHVRALIDYWAAVGEMDTRDRLEGLAHSLLVTLDGDAIGLPAYRVTPSPHPDDRAFHEQNEENWYPEDVDIGGGLHELLQVDR